MAKFYITTPIYYANAKPHIGHAYTTIAADVLARYHRMKGEEVFFLVGTDEHGEKIQKKAQEGGKLPQEFVDEVSASFKLAWDILDISNDYFIRTTDKEHERAVQFVLQTLFEKKYIYRGRYEALYCLGCEQYKTKADLVNGKCPDHQREPEIRSEEAYLFKLSLFQSELLKRIKNDEFKILPLERKNEVISFLEKEELKDIAISRRKEKVQWGVEFPFDKNHTCYVWIDAFLNYLTGLGWPSQKQKFKKFWPADIQLMSKDILRVHATIWPALLLALEIELPKVLFIHGFFTVNGQKMSKSVGNVIDPVEITQKYSPDVFRYFILREIPFGQDGDFSLKRLEKRYESDLANSLGNLVARVLGITERYTKNEVPKIAKNCLINPWEKYEYYFATLELDKVLETIWIFIGELNRFIDQEKPWALTKTNEKKLKEVVYILLESLRYLGWFLWPFMPTTSETIFSYLGLNNELKKRYNEGKKWGGLKPGIKINKGEPLFPRLIH
jgi:methionyl-tRNA synthetase